MSNESTSGARFSLPQVSNPPDYAAKLAAVEQRHTESGAAAHEPELTAPVVADSASPAGALRNAIIGALRGVFDPELPVNIYDLGLIYAIDIADNNDVAIKMTLTAPACPVAGEMPGMAQRAAERVPGIGRVKVNLVWDPPWTRENLSDAALLQLGLL